MTRDDYEELEAYAVSAQIGLLAGGSSGSPEQVAVGAFDIAEAMLAEKKKRLGTKPDYSCND